MARRSSTTATPAPVTQDAGGRTVTVAVYLVIEVMVVVKNPTRTLKLEENYPVVNSLSYLPVMTHYP